MRGVKFPFLLYTVLESCDITQLILVQRETQTHFSAVRGTLHGQR